MEAGIRGRKRREDRGVGERDQIGDRILAAVMQVSGAQRVCGLYSRSKRMGQDTLCPVFELSG